MNYYFITGTSSGIGKALVEELLLDNNNYIFGYSRTNSINHERFLHLSLDLSNLDTVSQYIFPDIENCEKITFINNAGTLGEIKYLGKLKSIDIICSFNVNITSVAVLTNSFINKYQDINIEKTIINISSGAALKAYDGWASYCSTKAAINMLTSAIVMEQSLKKYPIKAFAIAPGVVDTCMQDLIRKSDVKDFSNIEKFKNLKTSGSLFKTKDVAKQLISYCKNTNLLTELFTRIEL